MEGKALEVCVTATGEEKEGLAVYICTEEDTATST